MDNIVIIYDQIKGEVTMLRAIQNSPAIRYYLPAASSATGMKTAGVRRRAEIGNPAMTEVTAELTEKLNNLAKARPFNSLHRVKKYDPL